MASLRKSTSSVFWRIELAKAVVAATFCVACGAPPSRPLPPRLELTFLTDFNAPRTGAFDGLGGISGIAYDEDAEMWLAVSDARESSHFHELSIRYEDDTLSVEPRRVVPITDETGAPFAIGVLDPEGIVLTSSGTLLVSTEPDSRQQPVEQAKLLELDRDGKLVRQLDVPDKFVVSGWPPLAGLRNNAGFEALTVSPDGAVVFAGAESSLLQDGADAGFEQPAFCRLIAYRRENGELVPASEYVYPLGPVSRPEGFDEVDTFIGLVELVALSETRLLALERDFIREPAGERRSVNRLRIFSVDVAGATDVSALDRLDGGDDWRPVRKELLFDFDDILSSLSDGFQVLDNFEAMGLGPSLPGGGQSVIVVSDDNFRDAQRTAFLLFRLREVTE